MKIKELSIGLPTVLKIIYPAKYRPAPIKTAYLRLIFGFEIN